MGIVDYLARTMLLERMTGVVTYALLLGFFYLKIKNSRDNINISRLLRTYTFILCIMAFLYIPAETADLSRWRIIGEGWKSLNLSEFFNMYVLKSSAPVGYLFIYLCQKTGIDGLLPLLCALLFFFNTFYIVNGMSKIYNNEGDVEYPKYIAIGLLFLMCSGRFLETISGVRCMVAFSVVAKCFYCETIENKSILKSIVPYLLACLLHLAVIPLVALRIFAMIFEKKKSYWRLLVNVIAFGLMAFIAVRYGSGYIDASIEKANVFIANNVYSYSWEYIIASLQFVIIIVLLAKYYRLYRMPGSGVDNIAFIITILSVVEIILIRSYSIYHRYIGFSTFISIPLLVYVLQREYQQSRYTFGKFIKAICMIVLVLACLRGNLCAYKFFML